MSSFQFNFLLKWIFEERKSLAHVFIILIIVFINVFRPIFTKQCILEFILPLFLHFNCIYYIFQHIASIKKSHRCFIYMIHLCDWYMNSYSQNVNIIRLCNIIWYSFKGIYASPVNHVYDSLMEETSLKHGRNWSETWLIPVCKRGNTYSNMVSMCLIFFPSPSNLLCLRLVLNGHREKKPR